MKVSVPRQNPLSLPQSEQQGKHHCRQYTSISCSVVESLVCPREKQQLWWNHLEPGSSTDCFPPDDGLMSSFTANDAMPTKDKQNIVQPPLNWKLSASDPQLPRLTQTSFQGQHPEYTDFQDRISHGDADMPREKLVDYRHTDPSSSDEEHCSRSSVVMSECVLEQLTPDYVPENVSTIRVKLMCSFGGRIMARPPDGKLRYVGGETRIVSVCKGVSFAEFMSKMSLGYGSPLGLKYQLPNEDLDALISVSSDDDLQNMMEEYDKNEASGVTASRLRLFFFTTPADVECAESTLEGDDGCSNPDQRYVDAINGLPAKHHTNLLESDSAALHPSSAANSTEGVARSSSLEPPSEVAQFSAPSSSPSSPLASGHQGFHKSPGLIDVSLQNVSNGFNKAIVASFEGDTDQDLLSSSSSTPFHYHYDRSHFDMQFSQAVDSPRVARPDGLNSKSGENWPGLRHVDSQSKLTRFPEQHSEYRSNPGAPFEHWHEVVHVRDSSVPQGDYQRVSQSHGLPLPSAQQSYHPHSQQVQHQHQHHQVHQHQPHQHYLYHQQQQQHHHGNQQNQSHQTQHSRFPHHEGDNGRGELLHQESHKQIQHHQVPQHNIIHSVPLHDGSLWSAEHHGIPRSTQHGTHVFNGLAPAHPYQMGSNPSSPRVGAYDYHGKCPCGLQHSPVHRGITVSIGEQPYSRWWPTSPVDQSSRKQAMRSSSRFCDTGSYGLDAAIWQQANNPAPTGEAEHIDFTTQWPHNLGRSPRDMQTPSECLTRNRSLLYAEPVTHNEETLPTHDWADTTVRCMCANCVDNRRQHMEIAKGHPAFVEVADHTSDLSLRWKGFDVDGGRVTTSQKVYSRVSTLKGEEHFTVSEKNPEIESGISISQLPGEPESRVPQATHTEHLRKVQPSSATGTGNFAVSGEPMLTLALRTAELSPKLIKNSPELGTSRGLQSSEARYYYDVPSCQQVQQVKASMDLHAATVIGSFSGSAEAENSNKTLLPSQADNGATVPFPYHGDKLCGGAEGAESNLSQPCSPRIELDSNSNILAEHEDMQILSPSESFLGSVVDIGKSGQILSSPVWDQSSFTSSTIGKFSFAACKPVTIFPEMNMDKEPLTQATPATGESAGSLESSVLDGCSDEALAQQLSDADQDATCSLKEGGNVPEAAEEEKSDSAEAKSVSFQPEKYSADGAATAKDLKEGVKTVSGTTNGPDGICEANVCESSGVTPAGPIGGSNNTSDQKDAPFSELSEPSLCEAEAEAIARGLQIIKNSDVEDLKELGSGTYGTVYHGKWRGSDVAIKRIKESCFTGPPADRERLIADFWREACTLGQLHHPNVVAFYGVVPDGPGGTLATVTEYMINGSLKQVLHKKDRTIDRRKRLFIAMDAAFGMEYLHSKNIVHFDLKCENLLVNMRDAHRPICKVGDFGLSKVKHHTLVSGGVRGTLPWMAPELLSGDCGRVSEKVDVFSFGIVMWELLTGEDPYANMHCGAIISGIANNTLRPSIPNWCDPGWKNLMERCWCGNPAERPSFAEVAKELRAIAATMNLK